MLSIVLLIINAGFVFGSNYTVVDPRPLDPVIPVPSRRRLFKATSDITKPPFSNVMLLTFCAGKGGKNCAVGVGTVVAIDHDHIHLATCAHNIWQDYPTKRLKKNSFRAYSISDATKDVHNNILHAADPVYPYLENPDWVWAPDPAKKSHIGDWGIIRFPNKDVYGKYRALVGGYPTYKKIFNTHATLKVTPAAFEEGRMVTWNTHTTEPKNTLQQLVGSVTWNTPKGYLGKNNGADKEILVANQRYKIKIKDDVGYTALTANCLQGLKGMSGSPLFETDAPGTTRIITSHLIGIYVGKSIKEYCEDKARSIFVGITQTILTEMEQMIASKRSGCMMAGAEKCYTPEPAIKLKQPKAMSASKGRRNSGKGEDLKRVDTGTGIDRADTGLARAEYRNVFQADDEEYQDDDYFPAERVEHYYNYQHQPQAYYEPQIQAYWNNSGTSILMIAIFLLIGVLCILCLLINACVAGSCWYLASKSDIISANKENSISYQEV